MKIKLEAWDTERQIMWKMIPTEEGYYFVDNWGNPDWSSVEHYKEVGVVLMDDRFIVRIFTGNEDKNKKEIYSGDIIEDKWGNRYVVEFTKNCFYPFGSLACDECGSSPCHFEVRENIFENPPNKD